MFTQNLLQERKIRKSRGYLETNSVNIVNLRQGIYLEGFKITLLFFRFVLCTEEADVSRWLSGSGVYFLT